MLPVLIATASALPPLVERSVDASILADPSMAVVVFIRPETAGTPTKAIVLDEKGSVLGEARGNGWFAATVTPGSHTFVVWGDAPSALPAELEAGEISYVKIAPDPASSVGQVVLHGLGPSHPDWDAVGRWTSGGVRAYAVHHEAAAAWGASRASDVQAMVARAKPHPDAAPLTADDGVVTRR